MTLAKRVIPCLDVQGGRVVKGVKFQELRDAGDPVEAAKRYGDEGADEVVFLDISASVEERDTTLDMVAATADQLFIPLTVGGGVRTVDDFAATLRAGADKVAVNTAAVERPELITEASETFGAQCVVVAIDAQRDGERDDGGGGEAADGTPRWTVHTHGGRTRRDLDAVAWANKAEALGAGEILLTSMDADGTKAGYDNALNRAVSEAVSIPVIASGGCGSVQHMVDAVEEGRADAVLAASIFHYREITVGEVKAALAERGVEVRP